MTFLAHQKEIAKLEKEIVKLIVQNNGPIEAAWDGAHYFAYLKNGHVRIYKPYGSTKNSEIGK